MAHRFSSSTPQPAGNGGRASSTSKSLSSTSSEDHLGFRHSDVSSHRRRATRVSIIDPVDLSVSTTRDQTTVSIVHSHSSKESRSRLKSPMFGSDDIIPSKKNSFRSINSLTQLSFQLMISPTGSPINRIWVERARMWWWFLRVTRTASFCKHSMI